MKAIVYRRYGSPDVLTLAEMPDPVPGPDQVLVEVRQASVNPHEYRSVMSKPFFARAYTGWLRPKNPILGVDMAGVITRVGDQVGGLLVGDRVFGAAEAGAFAEMVCVESESIARIPQGVSFDRAAATPMVGCTALQGLRDAGKLQSGQHVLINGASGGIGTYAVQIAAAMGATVTGVCSTRNLELVSSIGAEQVVDYVHSDVTRMDRRYDLILDAVGNLQPAGIRRILAPGGICVVLGFTSLWGLMRVGFLESKKPDQQGRLFGSMGSSETTTADLEALGDMIAQGKIRPVIDRRYPLDKTAEALRYLAKGHARGKVILDVR